MATSTTSTPEAVDGLQAFKAQLDILALAEKLTEVTSSGGDQGKIVCPFHAEDSPSCYLYGSDNHFHCFGCSKHSDVFTLVMALRNCTFQEAIEWCAEQSGIPRPTRSPDEEARATSLRRLREAFSDGLDTAGDLPFGLSRDAARSLGLGRAVDLATTIAELPRPIVRLDEAARWEGAYTLELRARAGVIGFGALLGGKGPDLEGAHLSRAGAVRGPAFVGLGAVAELIGREGAVLVSLSAIAALRLQAAGHLGVIALAGPLDAVSAGKLAELAPRLIFVADLPDARGPALEHLLVLAKTSARVALAIDGPGGLSAPIGLHAYVSRLAGALSTDRREALLHHYLDALPSPSSRELYGAELRSAGLIPPA